MIIIISLLLTKCDKDWYNCLCLRKSSLLYQNQQIDCHNMAPHKTISKRPWINPLYVFIKKRWCFSSHFHQSFIVLYCLLNEMFFFAMPGCYFFEKPEKNNFVGFVSESMRFVCVSPPLPPLLLHPYIVDVAKYKILVSLSIFPLQTMCVCCQLSLI